MKNIITLLLVSIFIFATAGASADYDNMNGEKRGMEKHQALPGVDDTTKAAIQDLHESMKSEIDAVRESYEQGMSEDEKEELMEKVETIQSKYHDQVIELLGDNEEAIAALEERKEKMEEKQMEKREDKTENREEREELFAELDDDTKAELEALQAEYKEAMAERKESYNEDMTDDEKTEKKAEYDVLREAHQEKIAAVLEDYPEVLEAMQAKTESKTSDKKGGMNGENKRGEAKMEGESKMKGERGEGKSYNMKKGSNSEKKGKYKKQFVTKYQARLESISDEKLEKVLAKIVTYSEKVEANDKLTDERKENVFAQLEALAEMIQDILDGDDTDDIIDELLN